MSGAGMLTAPHLGLRAVDSDCYSEAWPVQLLIIAGLAGQRWGPRDKLWRVFWDVDLIISSLFSHKANRPILHRAGLGTGFAEEFKTHNCLGEVLPTLFFSLGSYHWNDQAKVARLTWSSYIQKIINILYIYSLNWTYFIAVLKWWGGPPWGGHGGVPGGPRMKTFLSPGGGDCFI